MRRTLHDTTWLLRVAAIASLATAISLALIDEPVARAGASRDAWPSAWNFVIDIGEYAIGIEPWKWLGVCGLAARVIATRVGPRWRPPANRLLVVAATPPLA